MDKLHFVGELKEHRGAIYAMTQGIEPETFFSSGADKLVVLWDANSIKQKPLVIKLEHTAYSLSVIPKKSELVIGDSVGHLHIIDLTTRNEVKDIVGHQSGIFKAIPDSEGNRLLTADADGLLCLWDSSDWSCLRQLATGNGKIRAMAYHPLLKQFVVGTGDGTILLVEPDRGLVANSYISGFPGITSIAVHPESGQIYMGNKDAILTEWQFPEIQLNRSLPAHYSAIYDICFGNSGNKMITVSRDKIIKLWDVHSATVMDRIESPNRTAHRHSVNAVIYLDVLGRFVTAGDDGCLKIWEIISPTIHPSGSFADPLLP